MFKLALGYCIVICLPRIHFEKDAAITTAWSGLWEIQVRLGGREEHTTTSTERCTGGMDREVWGEVQEDAALWSRAESITNCWYFVIPPQSAV